MSDLRVGGRVRFVSRKIHKAHVAVTTDGALVMNVACFGPANIEALIARALDNDAELFIGVVVEGDDRYALMDRLENAAAEAVALLYGKQKRRRER